MDKNFELSTRVKEGLSARLAERKMVDNLMKVSSKLAFSNKKLRQELLNMKLDTDSQRWQELHNNVDKYQVVSEKESHQKGEYFVRIIYYELGDDLPDVKTKEQLRDQNDVRPVQDND